VYVQVHPGLFAAGAPWLTGPAYKDTLAHYSNTAVPCTYVRDKGEGRVTIDKQGYPRVHYQISPFDQKSLFKVITCLLVLTAAVRLCKFGSRLCDLQLGQRLYELQSGQRLYELQIGQKLYELQIDLQMSELQLAAKHVDNL
jgi:hypothetical protein